jgi:quercetin dioxygenase-like cupin family protein
LQERRKTDDFEAVPEELNEDGWAAVRAAAQPFVTANSADIPWIDAYEIAELPSGCEVKVLRQDIEANERDLLVRFPPGYVEPAHTHAGEHHNIILEGRMLVDGKTLGPGDFMYGPSHVEHGPLEYPDGIVLFASCRGDLVHDYAGKQRREPV